MKIAARTRLKWYRSCRSRQAAVNRDRVGVRSYLVVARVLWIMEVIKRDPEVGKFLSRPNREPDSNHFSISYKTTMPLRRFFFSLPSLEKSLLPRYALQPRLDVATRKLSFRGHRLTTVEKGYQGEGELLKFLLFLAQSRTSIYGTLLTGCFTRCGFKNDESRLSGGILLLTRGQRSGLFMNIEPSVSSYPS